MRVLRVTYGDAPAIAVEDFEAAAAFSVAVGRGSPPLDYVSVRYDLVSHDARAADTVESVQLGMAGDLLDHVADMLDDPDVTPGQLRYVLARMSEALTDVKRVAESRGARLLAHADGGPGR